MYLITSMQNFRKILKVHSYWRLKAESGWGISVTAYILVEKAWKSSIIYTPLRYFQNYLYVKLYLELIY